jgi:crotonobetainyl-CoA:carnitine CoA-transferase CaiB-like acyl-CoA transferase
MTGPLDGIRVVDCSAYITGPFATMMLADQGADVVKIEPIGIGDVMRHLGTARGGISTLFAGCNRGKRSLALDISDERGREIVLELTKSADIFVQNFRPGVVERLGIGEPALRSVRPNLIYVSLSAFGPEGPWARKPAFDHVVQAAAGMAAVQSDAETGEPRFVQNAVTDKLTALFAAQAITAALYHRERTGDGQHVELCMLDAAIQFLWPDGMARDALLGGDVELRPPLASAYRMVTLKDGHVAVAAITEEQVHGLMRAVGRPEFVEDERFSNVNALLENLDEFIAETEAAAVTVKVADFVASLELEDVPCAPVLAPGELATHPQVLANRTIEEVMHPRMGAMRRPRPPVHFSGSPLGVSRHAPALGEHGDEVLAEIGIPDGERAELRAKGVLGQEPAPLP